MDHRPPVAPVVKAGTPQLTVGDFIAKYELLSGLGVVVITAAVGLLVRHVRRRSRAAPPAAANAILAARWHDVYDELLHLMHEATGRIIHLYGLRQEPLFADWSVEQLDAHMTSLGFPGKTKAAILADWSTDPRGALKMLRETARQGEIAEAERALGRAGNYLLDKGALHREASLCEGARGLRTAQGDPREREVPGLGREGPTHRQVERGRGGAHGGARRAHAR